MVCTSFSKTQIFYERFNSIAFTQYEIYYWWLFFLSRQHFFSFNLSLGCHFRLSIDHVQANCLTEMLGSSPLLVWFFGLPGVEIGRPGPMCCAFTKSHSLTFCGS